MLFALFLDSRGMLFKPREDEEEKNSLEKVFATVPLVYSCLRRIWKVGIRFDRFIAFMVLFPASRALPLAMFTFQDRYFSFLLSDFFYSLRVRLARYLGGRLEVCYRAAKKYLPSFLGGRLYIFRSALCLIEFFTRRVRRGFSFSLKNATFSDKHVKKMCYNSKNVNAWYNCHFLMFKNLD